MYRIIDRFSEDVDLTYDIRELAADLALGVGDRFTVRTGDVDTTLRVTALVDLGATWDVTEDGFQSKSRNSAFLGRTLHGVVRLTVSRGRVAWRRPGEAPGVAE